MTRRPITPRKLAALEALQQPRRACDPPAPVPSSQGDGAIAAGGTIDSDHRARPSNQGSHAKECSASGCASVSDAPTTSRAPAELHRAAHPPGEEQQSQPGGRESQPAAGPCPALVPAKHARARASISDVASCPAPAPSAATVSGGVRVHGSRRVNAARSQGSVSIKDPNAGPRQNFIRMNFKVHGRLYTGCSMISLTLVLDNIYAAA